MKFNDPVQCQCQPSASLCYPVHCASASASASQVPACALWCASASASQVPPGFAAHSPVISSQEWMTRSENSTFFFFLKSCLRKLKRAESAHEGVVVSPTEGIFTTFWGRRPFLTPEDRCHLRFSPKPNIFVQQPMFLCNWNLESSESGQFARSRENRTLHRWPAGAARLIMNGWWLFELMREWRRQADHWSDYCNPLAPHHHCNHHHHYCMNEWMNEWGN